MAETPSSRHHHILNPLAQFTPSNGDVSAAFAVSTPSLNRKLFSPVMPTSIGPTPQRDGRVLGLFDALPFKEAEIDSPCKPNGAVKLSQVIQAGREAMVEETPRTSRVTDVLDNASKLGRTPSSRHKRHQQQSPRAKNILITPLKPHDGNRVAKTPGTSSSASKLQFQTPAFLRRIPMPQISEINSEFKSPEPIRLPRKPLLRGLSSVVADLRRLQEEELDDDLDALRDMENEGVTTTKPGPTQSNPTQTNSDAKPVTTTRRKQEEVSILAEDSQKQNLGLLGGFDDEGQYDSPDEADAGLDRNGQPLRVYKKKGQKRTTRRSNMKPVRTRRPTTAAASGDADKENEAEVTAAPLTSSQTLVAEAEEEEDPALLSGSEFGFGAADDDDEDELAKDINITTKKKPTTRTRGAKAAPAATKKTAAGATGDDKTKPAGGVVKKAARKVNELAHANFKRLKLRNNGAKGGPGYNSRFRRRR